jgi:hypothetical protein
VVNGEGSGEREERIQMANGKEQMANGLSIFNLSNGKLKNHLNFAICHLPFALFLLSPSPHQN